MLADTENRCGGFALAVVTSSLARVWGRAAVAMVVALAAVCVMVPSAQARLVAFQKSDGGLWTVPFIESTGTDVRAGMAAGTSPSINIWGDIAFQANTGNLDVTGTGDLHLGMMPGTSPSIDNDGQVAFQANSGDLWQIGGHSCNCSWKLGMTPGTSPSIQPENPLPGANHEIAFQANTGQLWNLALSPDADTRLAMAAGTSPSTIDVDGVTTTAFQGSNSNLWTWDTNNGGTDLRAGMAPGTSPSISG
jgi:hypothetical protein